MAMEKVKSIMLDSHKKWHSPGRPRKLIEMKMAKLLRNDVVSDDHGQKKKKKTHKGHGLGQHWTKMNWQWQQSHIKCCGLKWP